ncbi:MAG: two-component regulator propeller domain-containing protein, partial [Ginsengibacter sp.]
MKPPTAFLLFLFFLLQLKGFNSFSQQAVITRVPYPAEGSAWVGTQDANGYMWFGGEGVHRYDGYSYKSYFNDPRDSSSLVQDRIESICADAKGFIWVATNRKGLDRLDPETGIFTHYRHNPSDTNSISSDTISALLIDRQGKIWIGTEYSGLNCLDPATGSIIRYRHDPKEINSLSYDKVTALYEDQQGTIWVGTGFLWHFGKLTGKQGGLNRFNPAEKNFTRFLHDPEDSSSLIDNRVRSIFEDSKGRFWVGTSGDGLHIMNREKGSFQRHRYNSSNSNGLSRPPVKNTLDWADDMITFINEDAAGTIWIGTLTGGLNNYDPETGKMTYHTTLNENSTNKKDIPQFIWSGISKDGLLWIGSWNGSIYRLDPFHKKIPQYDVGYTVKSLFQDSGGKLWIGTVTNGLIVYDAAGINKEVFVNNISDTKSLSGNLVNSIFEDKRGTIWIGTDKGLDSYNQQSKKFTHHLVNNRINAIYEDNQGLLWLGTTKGLVLMNRKDDSFTQYRFSSSDKSIPDHHTSCIAEDQEGNLWIGSGEWGGLQWFDKKNNKTLPYLPNTTIQSIFEDTNATLWIGTKRGLYYKNRSSNSFILFSDPGSGFTENITVYHILEDDRQFLWINTSLGLFRLRKDRSEIILFEKKGKEIPPIYYADQAGCFKGKGGKLYFSSNFGNGYYAFFPERLKGNASSPELHISEFRLGNQLVYPGKNSPLSVPVSQTKEIRLQYNQDIFSFVFAGLHYSSPENNRHLFMLENLDNDWRKAGDDKTAHYYNVPPGHYVFRVKAASSDGVWTEKSITVIISPPWWRTWWAYCIYGLLIIASVFAIHSIQKKRVIEAERERTREKEMAQAKEIEKAYRELQTTQAQLVQREKMASLGELTAGIAHEIQNPLNFVNNFSEVNTELIDELNEEAGKGNLDEVKAIAKNIKENEQKINHHGKRADAIVKGMLQHSRSSTGQKEPTDINALCDEYLRLSYHGLRAKDKSFNADFKTDFDKTIGKINIIPQDIGRVILNLLTNAFYAVNEKKKQVEQDLTGFKN